MATISICICDESTEATLSAYGTLIKSAQEWVQHETILLITSPGGRPGRKLSIRARTMIEINPNISESAWLRRWMQRVICPINDHFPADLFDVESSTHAPVRLQFTLANLDSFVRASPSRTHLGYLSVVVTELNLLSLWNRGQLFSMECCGLPIYANAINGQCDRCGRSHVHLRINPNVVGEMADETGAVSCTSRSGHSFTTKLASAGDCMKQHHSKILWTDEAWTLLLGRTPEQFVALWDNEDGEKTQHNAALLSYLEQRLLFLRVILFVGWTGDSHGGRLAVLSVVG